MPEENQYIVKRIKLRRLCIVYIDTVLDGYWGNQMRAECHLAFLKLLPGDFSFQHQVLKPILYNLDHEVGLEFVGQNGIDVEDKHRRRYARLLFERLWKLYIDEGLSRNGGDVHD